jgi:hypothetical protein
MKSKRKTSKAKKGQVKMRDMKPRRSPAGGGKRKRGGSATQPVQYMTYKMSDVIISG